MTFFKYTLVLLCFSFASTTWGSAACAGAGGPPEDLVVEDPEQSNFPHIRRVTKEEYRASLAFDSRFTFTMKKITDENIEGIRKFLEEQENGMEKIGSDYTRMIAEHETSFSHCSYWETIKDYPDTAFYSIADFGSKLEILGNPALMERLPLIVTGVKNVAKMKKTQSSRQSFHYALGKHREKEMASRDDSWMVSINKSDGTPLMVGTVTSADNCLITRHKGIFQTVAAIVDPTYESLENTLFMSLHSFAAQVMLMSNPWRVGMMNDSLTWEETLFIKETGGYIPRLFTLGSPSYGGEGTPIAIPRTDPAYAWLEFGCTDVIKTIPLNVLAQWTPRSLSK